MPEYRRPFAPGGTFFFTVVTQNRQPILCSELARPILHSAIATTANEHPFTLLAMVLFDDHLHAIWELPAGDADFSRRWGAIKGRFTRAYLLAGGNENSVSHDRAAHGGRGVWQPRFYDHLIRDDADLRRHLDYIHFNPVKHGKASCPHAYPCSTFDRWVRDKGYAGDWCCRCDDRRFQMPSLDWAEGRGME